MFETTEHKKHGYLERLSGHFSLENDANRYFGQEYARSLPAVTSSSLLRSTLLQGFRIQTSCIIAFITLIPSASFRNDESEAETSATTNWSSFRAFEATFDGRVDGRKKLNGGPLCISMSPINYSPFLAAMKEEQRDGIIAETNGNDGTKQETTQSTNTRDLLTRNDRLLHERRRRLVDGQVGGAQLTTSPLRSSADALAHA